MVNFDGREITLGDARNRIIVKDQLECLVDGCEVWNVAGQQMTRWPSGRGAIGWITKASDWGTWKDGFLELDDGRVFDPLGQECVAFQIETSPPELELLGGILKAIEEIGDTLATVHQGLGTLHSVIERRQG